MTDTLSPLRLNDLLGAKRRNHALSLSYSGDAINFQEIVTLLPGSSDSTRNKA